MKALAARPDVMAKTINFLNMQRLQNGVGGGACRLDNLACKP